MTSRRVYVAGHRGMVGSAIVRALAREADVDVVTATRKQLDLTDQRATRRFFARQRIDEVYLAAARVGGIQANVSAPADFIYQNLMIEVNVINAAHQADVNKLLFLGSSCIYPRDAAQPMAESSLLTGPLESTNEPYAVAKIAGIKLAESYARQHQRDYRSVMPTNLYGPGDNFDGTSSHVLPALLRRFHDAVNSGVSEVVVWGSGRPRREFLHVDDMAAASVFVMNLERPAYWGATGGVVSHINVGTGLDLRIRELVDLLSQETHFSGVVTFDVTKPDGTPRKLLNVDLLTALGWTAKISLRQGIADTYKWFLKHATSYRGL